MGTISVNRLAGLSLIFGPIIAFVFFLIEPGGLLIDSAEVSDSVGTIKAKGGNAALTNVTNIAIILGLSLILSGLYALMRNVTLQGNGKALAQMGFFMILVGLTGWIFRRRHGLHSGRCPNRCPDQRKRSRLLRRLRSPLRRRDRAWVWRLHFRVGPLHERRLQPDNLPAGRPCQPGRDGLLRDSHTQQRQPRHLYQPGQGLLRATGHLVWVSGLRADEKTRSRSVAVERTGSVRKSRRTRAVASGCSIHGSCPARAMVTWRLFGIS